MQERTRAELAPLGKRAAALAEELKVSQASLTEALKRTEEVAALEQVLSLLALLVRKYRC
jgi:hypothetical protein